ncbi:uncharacterized protein [Amphiura filiformis]|uniref:uncharacterized protein n=1 Tax=Amphiura filiformis TaxID=82378 RepID=UPI003B21358F
MFNATDTYNNLNEVFSIYYDQLAELMNMKTIVVNGVEKPLRIFLYGDYEFLCKYVGHMGPASSHPCLWCNITLQELRKPTSGEPHCPRVKENQWNQNANWAKPRSAEQYVQDYADLSSDSGTRPITGHMYHSISKRPLFPLCAGVDHIVPPSLHILLGLVVRYFNLLELECRKLDQGGLEERDLEQCAEWWAASEQAKKLENECSEAKSALAADEKLLQCFVRAKRGRNIKGLTSDPCSMPLCALASSVPAEVDRNNVQWIRCTRCGKGDEMGWYHAYCVGIKEAEIDLPCYNEWTCQVCTDEISGPDDVIPCQEERVTSNKALVKEKEAAYAKAKDKLDKVYDKIAKARGQYEKMLNERLENDLHVKRQAYHSQCFVGNHCKAIVDNPEVLLQDLPDGEMKNKFQGLFGRLRKIFKLFKADFLSEEEVRELCVRCWELGYFVPKNFPLQTVPPKLHMLICHVPEIAMKWKTIGLLSEHGLESIHAVINSMERVYCTVRDKTEHMRLVFGSHQQRTVTAKTGLEVPPVKIRVCRGDIVPNCKGRYVTNTDKKTRTCKQCKHVLVLESK